MQRINKTTNKKLTIQNKQFDFSDFATVQEESFDFGMMILAFLVYNKNFYKLYIKFNEIIILKTEKKYLNIKEI
jgi:hypothetical protein